MENDLSFTCPCCGQDYNLNLCFGSEYPLAYFSIPDNEREERIELTKSLCVIDEEHFFHRCRLIIPIIDHTEDLIFNVWTSISEENFVLRNELWNNAERINEGPYFGWLNNNITTYGNTVNIKTIAHENEVGSIPSLEVIEEGHALTYDQANGITLEHAIEKVKQIVADSHKTSS